MNVAKRFNGMPALLRRLPWRPVPFAVALALVIAARRGDDVNAASSSPSAALAEVLTLRGFACSADDVVWTRGPAGVTGAMRGGARALVRASTHGDPNDIYLVEARVSPEGWPLEVGGAWNLTRTASVDESRPVVRGHLAAYTTTVDTLATGVHTLDLAGQTSDTAYADYSRTQRTQMAITNLQQTGQTSGILHNAFSLEPPATRAELAWQDDGMLAVTLDGPGDPRVVLDPQKGEPVSGGDRVRAAPEEKAKPGNVVTWAVDRVRDMPWFGEEKMQWVKAIAFTALDWVNARFAKDATAQDVQKELGDLNAGQPNAPTFTDPEIGWPPAAIKPLLSPALPGEGQWIALDKDPFVAQTPGAPAAFLTSFIRPNAKRLDLRVYVTLWDPRQIALHMESGTVEPVSATGERGPGLIPREPEVMKRVVAAFNGGFQAQHGEFGMQANRIMYLPPKPYGATVMEMRDGSTAFGTWPPTNAKTDGVVPDEILSYRQNLTPLVEFDKWNPWNRTWWGGTPPGWGDNIHTARSAICLTKENFVGYFWSASISAEDLGAALLGAGCQYGIHLDMNPGHAGFEFYAVMPASEWKPLGRPLHTDWEAEGKVGQMPDWMFRARRMIRGMGHMSFPRYIQREGRDFFYLTSRPVLPGAELVAPIDPKEPGEGQWRTKGLPQHGFPYALATTSLRPDAKLPSLKVRVLRVDPRAVKPAGSAAASTDAPTVLSFSGAAPPKPHPDEWALYYGAGGFSIGAQQSQGSVSATGAVALVIGIAPAHAASGAPNAASARAAVGVHDEDGMLNWVELAEGTTADASSAAAMLALLEKLGCSSRMLVADTRALLGGALDLAGNPVSAAAATAPASRLVRGTAPGAHAMFEDTTLVPYSVWQPLQAQRVRVLQQAKPSAPSASSTAAAPSPPAPPPSTSSSGPSSSAPPIAPPRASSLPKLAPPTAPPRKPGL
jgi:hypothetical protein